MAIEIDKDTRARAIQALQAYFTEKRDEEIGNLQAQFLLDFFIAHVGPSIYNKAVADAQALMSHKLIDIDGELFEDEPRD